MTLKMAVFVALAGFAAYRYMVCVLVSLSVLYMNHLLGVQGACYSLVIVRIFSIAKQPVYFKKGENSY